MNAAQKKRNETLGVIGRELDDLEMFCQEARDPEWWNWMTQKLRKPPTRRVA